MIIICGCLIALLSFGPRSSLGFFIQPMSREFAWGRDVFGLALALQNLLWGLGQPIAGAIADRFGIMRVMIVGALLYAGGLLLMRYSTTPLSLDLGAGVLIGFGLSGCSFNLVLSAFSKLLPPEKRGLALGAGTAAGSFGQFLFAPFGVAMIDNFGWQAALTVFAFLMLLIVPLSLALATPPSTHRHRMRLPRTSNRSRPRWRKRSAIAPTCCWCSASSPAAFSSPSSPCICRPIWPIAASRRRPAAGWSPPSVCSTSSARSASAGCRTNIPSAISCRSIYFARALSIVAFISFPITTFSAIVFGAATGLTWLSTVPPTSALVALMFGTRWFATLYGFAFVSHQVGGFLGVWLGGMVFEQFGSYTPIWWLSILFGVLSALINLPIVEAPVARPVAQPA